MPRKMFAVHETAFVCIDAFWRKVNSLKFCFPVPAGGFAFKTCDWCHVRPPNGAMAYSYPSNLDCFAFGTQ